MLLSHNMSLLNLFVRSRCLSPFNEEGRFSQAGSYSLLACSFLRRPPISGSIEDALIDNPK